MTDEKTLVIDAANEFLVKKLITCETISK